MKEQDIEIGGKNGVPLPPPLPSSATDQGAIGSIYTEFIPKEPVNNDEARSVPPPPPKDKILPTRIIPEPPPLSFTRPSAISIPIAQTVKRNISPVVIENNETKKHKIVKQDEHKAMIDTSKIFRKKKTQK